MKTSVILLAVHHRRLFTCPTRCPDQVEHAAEEAQADLDTCEAWRMSAPKDANITQDINAASGASSGAVPSAPDMQGYQSREDYNGCQAIAWPGSATKAP
jgi:hypothetical protein